ncbi:diguanylate cyclase [Halomonas campisalis]|uniref:diguanylate cyclase n=1 Tax=Billgrantia campisalis TaxID=74661 RepID=A0ABS9PBG5_9GAMM|nr:GGDEF domain-containing protein [Halomonas campisalis]MCG6659101.1 diguanylate cyclase [Halomonas campisalis]MDR5863864.1 diguanylate cyclase [Halomonas campisalis]
MVYPGAATPVGSFEALVQGLPVPVLVVGCEGEILFANEAALGLFEPAFAGEGLSLGRLWSAVDCREIRECWSVLPEMEPGEEEGTDEGCHGPFSTLAGQTFAEVRLRRLAWQGRAAIQLTLLSPLWHGEAEQVSLYREMFTTNPAVKLLIDPRDGRIVDANPSAAAFYGYSLAELKRMNVVDINCLAPDEIRARMAEARACHQLFFEFRHRTATGEQRDVHVYTGPVTVGERHYLHSIIVDVTDEKRYQAQLEIDHELFRHLPVGVYRNTPGPEGRFITVNRAMLEIFEAESEQALLAVPLARLYEAPEQREAFSEALLREGAINRWPLRMRSLKGRPIWVEVTARRRTEPDGSVVFDGVIEDVTARREAQVLTERLTHLLDASPDFVSITDAEQRVVYLNQAGRRLVGELPEALPEALAAAHPEWARRLIENEGIPFAQRHGYWYAETALYTPQGELPVSQLIVARRNEDGKPDSIATILRDISQTKRYQAELEHLAGHDPLTGAVNRGRFLTLLERERALALRGERPLSLVMLDLDHFKRVNDGFGHSIGDKVLRTLVAICKEHLREVDVLARWGGEEFMLLLPDTPLSGAMILAERLRQAIEAANFHPVPRVTSSFGVAEISPEEPDACWLKRLDAALYRAKAEGRNRLCSAAPSPLNQDPPAPGGGSCQDDSAASGKRRGSG